MPADSPDWQAATDVAPILLGTVTVPANTFTGATTFSVPGTATALRLAVGNTVLTVSNVQVVGTTTGTVYANINVLLGAIISVYDVPVAAAIDPQVTVTVTITTRDLSAHLVAYVVAMGASGVQGVYAAPSNPVPVDIVTPSPVPVTVPLSPQVIPVASATLAMKTASLTASVVSGTPNVLVAGVAGKIITVYGYEFDISPTTGANIGRYETLLDDTTAATVVGRGQLLWQTAAGAGSQRWSRQMLYGVALPVGAGLQVAVPAGSTGPVTVVGAVDYTQG